MSALPARATLVEVGPRDGLQSLGRWVPTEDKVWLIERLAAHAGLAFTDETA